MDGEIKGINNVSSDINKNSTNGMNVKDGISENHVISRNTDINESNGIDEISGITGNNHVNGTHIIDGTKENNDVNATNSMMEINGIKDNNEINYINGNHFMNGNENQIYKENYIEYELPYGWKKIGRTRSGRNMIRWYFYVYSPDGTKLRSNPKIKKYLEENPDVKCDLNVTNTDKTDDVESFHIKGVLPEEKLINNRERESKRVVMSGKNHFIGS